MDWYEFVKTAVQVLTFLVASAAAWKASKARDAASEAKASAAVAAEIAAKVEVQGAETREALDGRLSELLKVSKVASRAEGHAEGMAQERKDHGQVEDTSYLNVQIKNGPSNSHSENND